MRLFTTDTHFGHRNIIRYANRPFVDIYEMDEILIRNWNRVVGPDDEVFHLGDAALGDWTRWHNIFSRLNGQIILVIGNHDRIFAGAKESQQQRFVSVYNGLVDDYYDNIENFELTDGTVVNLSHFPYTGDSHDGDRYEPFRLSDHGIPLIHGHTHHRGDVISRSSKGTLQIHVGVDAPRWDYTPVPEAVIIDLLREHS